MELQEEDEYYRGFHWIRSQEGCSAEIGVVTEPRAEAKLLVGLATDELNGFGIQIDSVPESSNGIAQWWLVVDWEDDDLDMTWMAFTASGIKKQMLLKEIKENGEEDLLLPGEELGFYCQGSLNKNGIYECSEEESELKLVLTVKNEHYYEAENLNMSLSKEGTMVGDGKNYSFFLIPDDGEELEKHMDSLEAGETVSVEWNVHFGVLGAEGPNYISVTGPDDDPNP